MQAKLRIPPLSSLEYRTESRFVALAPVSLCRCSGSPPLRRIYVCQRANQISSATLRCGWICRWGLHRTKRTFSNAHAYHINSISVNWYVVSTKAARNYYACPKSLMNAEMGDVRIEVMTRRSYLLTIYESTSGICKSLKSQSTLGRGGQVLCNVFSF